MSNAIIDELLQHSMDSETSVSQLVKYCSILADNIDDAEMGKWCEAELYGFDDLPEYRKVYGEVTALDLYNRRIKVRFSDAEMSELLSVVWVQQPIGDLEDMVKNIEPGANYKYPFPPEIAQNFMAENPRFTSLFWVIQAQVLSKIVQHVRSQVFKWARELKKREVHPSGTFPTLRSKGSVKGDSQITINAETLNAGALGTGNTIKDSPVQIATVSSNQNVEYSAADFKDIINKLEALLKYLSNQESSSEIMHLREEVNTLKGLLNQPKLRSSWISETLSSIRGVLENATGSAIAAYADKAHLIEHIGKLIGA